jgi:transposase-like protein
MPWRSVDVSEQRVRFVVRAVDGREPLARLCREFGISRPTGYVWRRRYEQTRTVTALVERSRRPHRTPGRTPEGTEQQVVALPEGSEVRQLNTQGSLAEGRQRLFVCQALAERRVRVERFDGKLLVSYRHMYIREIDLASGQSRPLVIERTRDTAIAAEQVPPVALQAPSGSGPGPARTQTHTRKSTARCKGCLGNER